jgi:transcriptional regulator with XRE-family HTH domain
MGTGTIGGRLRLERERLGLSQEEFAKAGGVGRQSQVRFESGERSPDADYLAGIAKAGADVLYIVTGSKRGR